MKIERFSSITFLLICIASSAMLKDFEALEKTFNLFENKCFVNILFVGFTANFVLHDTPIQQTVIDSRLTSQKIWRAEFINPQNRSLWPSWRMKYLECVLNTIVILPTQKPKFLDNALLFGFFSKQNPLPLNMHS